MTEPSTITLTCSDCGVEILRKNSRGNIPRLCGPCAKERRRISIRDYGRRKRAGIKPAETFDCERCGGTFPRAVRRGPLPRTCGECFQKRERERSIKRWASELTARQGAPEPETGWFECQDCKERVQRASRVGRVPLRCEPCRAQRRRELDKSTRPWVRTGECIDCGGKTSRKSSDTVRLRCPKCLELSRHPKTGRWVDRVSAYRRDVVRLYGVALARTYGPARDRFLGLEIIERDRWVCQLCKRRISKRFKGRHRRRATLDHIIPKSQGGTDLRENMRAAHFSCNSARNNRGGNEQLALLSV